MLMMRGDVCSASPPLPSLSLQGRLLLLANVGDSQAVLGSYSEAGSGLGAEVRGAVAVTPSPLPHTPRTSAGWERRCVTAAPPPLTPPRSLSCR